MILVTAILYITRIRSACRMSNVISVSIGLYYCCSIGITSVLVSHIYWILLNVNNV